MTFSIVARDGGGVDSDGSAAAFGVAVASRFLGVGAAVPAAATGAGALATQAFANLGYRRTGLALLRAGRAAGPAVTELTGADPMRDERQVGVVGRTGEGATFTGARCLPWAGGAAGAGYAIQGNILTGPEVVAEMERAWLASDPSRPLADRLLAALRAGDAAGGDRRGRQSAALLVAAPGGFYGPLAGPAEQAEPGGPVPDPPLHSPEAPPDPPPDPEVAVDLRVDDHPDPVAELGRLLELHHLYFDRADPATALELSGALAEEVTGLLRRVGRPDLLTWMGVENLETRHLPGRIDPLVLDRLREAAR